MNNGIPQEDDGGGIVPKKEELPSLGVDSAIKVEIKQENELIIEDYHQQQEQEHQLCSPKIEEEEDEYQEQHYTEYEHNGYSIKFLEDCDDSQDIDYFNDDSVDQEGSLFNGDQKEEEIDYRNRQYTDFYKKLIDLQNRNCVVTICPFCDQITKSFSGWTRHMATKHPKLLDDIRIHFGDVVYSKAECKLCSETICRNINRLLHYFTKHCTKTKALFECQLCKERYLSTTGIVKHLDDKHGQFNDFYRQCPLCCEIFSNRELMRKHFQELHQVEFMEKFNFMCHLCRHPRFEKLEQLYGHLINIHQLCGRDFEASHFKAFENLRYQCLTCGENCLKSGSYTLLNHHLKHEDESKWFCKFCLKNFKFTETMHLCNKMYKHFRKDTGEEGENYPSLPGPSKQLVGKSRIVSKQNDGDWKSFENYVQLCCPFCNQGFEQFQEWQVHLREKHFTNTLKGLNMKQAANGIQKLQCIECNNSVAAVCGLYAHCFQHLPYKPFKCRHCSQSLENYKMAFQHFQNKCNEYNVSLDDFEDVLLIKMASEVSNSIVILCSLCKGKQFATPEEIETHFEEVHDNFEHNFTAQENSSAMVCKVCNNTVEGNAKYVFLSHYKEHLSEGPYKCVFCQRSYTSYERCRIHVNRYHMAHVKPQTIVRSLHQINPKPSKSTQKPSPKPSVANGLGVSPYKNTIFNEFCEFLTFACPECNAPFPTLNAWTDHINENHTFFEESNLAVFDKAKGKPTCRDCNIVVCTSTSQQQKHKMTHMPYKAYVCTLCDTRTTTSGLLYSHLRRMHFSMGSFPCPVCAAVLNNAYERSVHVKETHPRSEWPENMCLICYRNYRNLYNHMLTHDTDRPKYFCPVCDIGIVSMGDMRVHIEKKHNQIAGNDFKLQRKRQSEKEQSPHKEQPTKTYEKKPKREDISKL